MSVHAASPAGDEATVTVTVAVPPADAFEIFTRDINLWWRRGPRFRNVGGDTGLICIEPCLGGRVFESGNDATGANETVVEIGRIGVWDPPRRLKFVWRASNFSAPEETEVEVVFEPTRSGTRVTLMHRGWSRIRADHPVRHGLATAEFVRMMGMWWGEQMTSLRVCAAARRET